METAYIIITVVIVAGIVTLVIVLRKRITRIAMKFNGNSLDLEAEPSGGDVGLPTLTGKGIYLDDSKVRNSNVKITDSTLVSRGSRVEEASIDVSETPPTTGDTDD